MRLTGDLIRLIAEWCVVPSVPVNARRSPAEAIAATGIDGSFLFLDRSSAAR